MTYNKCSSVRWAWRRETASRYDTCRSISTEVLNTTRLSVKVGFPFSIAPGAATVSGGSLARTAPGLLIGLLDDRPEREALLPGEFVD